MPATWATHITPHYQFHFHPGSFAANHIHKAAELQEACYSRISQTLGVSMPIPIKYYLCESAEEVGKLAGDDSPSNGYAKAPDIIYAVYTEKIDCLGPHEDAHLLSYQLGKPASAFWREGLAMYFEGTQFGLPNAAWMQELVRQGRYAGVEKLCDNKYFSSVDTRITYPIAGYWTEYLITTYGLEKFRRFYADANTRAAFTSAFATDTTRAEHDLLSQLRSVKLNKGIRKDVAERLKAITTRDESATISL